jgi:hypothetical protein
MVKQDHLHTDPEPQKAVACPFAKCASKPIRLGMLTTQGEWWVWCKVCGSAGPHGHGELEAVQLWNDRNLLAQTPPQASKGPSPAKIAAFLIVLSLAAAVVAEAVMA